MDIEKAKKQFELVKDTETFVITTVTFKSLLEEVEDQTKWADTYFKELQEAKKEIEELKDELFEAYRMQLKGMVVGGQLDWIRNRILELED